jgi:hypothetical protein
MPRRFISLAAILLYALLFASIAPVNAGGPDFSKVNDILQGRRTLFPSEDIIVSQSGSFEPTITTLLQTTGDAISSQTPYTIAPLNKFSSLVTTSAPMFNLPRDVVVTVIEGETNLIDQIGGFNQNFTNPLTGLPGLLNTNTVTDLTGNGFADVAFLSMVPRSLNTMTAADTNDLSQGFFYGTPVPVDFVGPYGLAAGDFDGDGVNEIALAYTSGNSIVVAIYKPNATTNPEGNKVTSLTLTQVGSTSVPFPSASNGWLALTAGAYGGLPNPRLVLVYTNGSQTNVQPITVTPTSNSTQVTLKLAPLFTLAQNSTTAIFAQSGYLDFFDNAEQVVLDVQGNASKTIDVLTFDANLNVTLASSLPVPVVDQKIYSEAIRPVFLDQF